MKKAITFVLGASLLSLAATAQVNKQERSIGHFSAIQVEDAITVVVTMSDKENLVFMAEDKILDKLKAEVKGNALVLTCPNCNTTKEMTAYINARTLENIEASDAASLRIINTLTTPKLKMEVSDASSVEFTVETDELKASVHDASSLTLKGHAKKMVLNVHDASTVKGSAIEAEEADVTANDASTVKCNARVDLKATARDASTIIYCGNPKNVNSNASAASTIKKAKSS